MRVSSNIQCLKQKLTNICKASKFCGICLDSNEKLWALDTEFDIAVDQQAHKKLLKDIIDYIFNDVGYQILASTHLCSQCTEKSIQSYLFIFNVKQLSQIICRCVDELYSKTVDVHDQLTQYNIDFENSNIVIALEQDSDMYQYTDIGKMTEIIAKETPKAVVHEFTGILKETFNQVEDTKVSEDENLTSFEQIKEEEVTIESIQPTFTEIIPHIVHEQEQSKQTKANKIEYIKSADMNTEKTNFQNEDIETSNTKLSSTKILDAIEMVNDIEITLIDDFSAQEILNTPDDNKDVKVLPMRKRKNMVLPSLTYKCKRCREVLPSYKGWKEHENICRKQKDLTSKHIFKCKICNEIFISQRTLNTHYKTHSKVKCQVCQFIIPAEDLSEHMKINHEDNIYSCKLCKFFSFNVDVLKLHVKKNHSGSKCALCHKKVCEKDLKLHKCRFNCLECSENICIHYKYLVSYRDQILNNIKEIKCLDCDYICPRREALLSHANREHLDHHPFTCAHCSQQFYSRTTLRHHLNQFHKEQHRCEFCDEEFNTVFTLNNHKETCQNIKRHNKCDQCNSSFVTLEELANHVKLRHDNECFNCSLCKKQFLLNTKLQEHIFRVHSGLQMKRKRSILDCPICDVKYATKKELLEHTKIHSPDSRFPCKDCNADFDSLKKLHAHVRIHYDDVIQCVDCKKVLTSTFFPHHMVYCKPGKEESKDIIYTCETCGKNYNSGIQLKLHRKTHMEKIPCPLCQKPTKPVYMKNHIKYMHSKPKKPKKDPKAQSKYYIKCELCPHRVSRHGELETHVNRFHLKIKPYQCNYCKKSFFGKERLKGHLVTHTTLKTCYCPVCNKKFENNVCLKLHMRRHTGEKPYACEFCGERFRTSSIMNTHKVKKHSERTVACPLCNSMFFLTREMRSHFKKVHWKQKDKKFDPRDVKELSPAFYHLFEDGRLPKVEGEDLYISSKINEKFS